jgi:hypothetical protein
MDLKKKSTGLKPFLKMSYTFHRTETKVTCYKISHNCSKHIFARLGPATSAHEFTNLQAPAVSLPPLWLSSPASFASWQ